MRHLKLKSIISLLFIVTLSACTTIDSQRPNNILFLDKNDPQWQQHLQQLKQISAYQVSGQLGYISNKERFSSRFDWQYQNPTSYYLKLYSTLSSTTLTLQMHPQGLTISDNKGRQRSDQDAQALMREIIGMDLPLSQLAFWLKGQPDEKQNYLIGSNHLLATFNYPINDSLWAVDYLAYQTEKFPLPKDILLQNQTQKLKIRLDNWSW